MNIARIEVAKGTITEGNISVLKHLEMFPVDSIGGPNKKTQARRSLMLHLAGGKTIVTDIAGDKNIFRDGRPTIKAWINEVKANIGDHICIKKNDDDSYAIWLEKISPDSPVQELANPIEKIKQLSRHFEENNCMNTILYGPPGTGKTYSIVLKAMSIIDGIHYTAGISKSDYANLKKRYDQLCMNGQIAFVTFHQSYGYEDFIEGIRPRTDGQMISYEVRDGILKTISLRAMENWLRATATQKNGADEGDIFEKAFQFLEEALEESPNAKVKITLYRGGAGELEMGAMGRSVVASLPGYKTTFNLPKSQLKKLWVRREEIKRPADTKLYNSSFFWAVLEYLKGVVINVTQQPQQPLKQEDLKPFFLVIDEINRGNISKIFGELITLIEEDKRIGAPHEMRVTLPYSQEDEDPFGLPPNLYILGTMNTSDRSIALLDTALRRRFEFEEIRPEPTTLKGIEVEGGINLSEMLIAMNERIEYLYDRDHTIGHAYFINVRSLSDLETVFRRKIIPLLQEYFYEDWAKVRLALNDKDGSFIEEKNDIPKGLESIADGYGPKPRYIVKDKFTDDAYRKIYT